jgi:DNA-binding response OmpR family regulator
MDLARILVVDDDEALRKLLKQRLKDSYEVVDTADPTEALSLALDVRPDCILLDLLMPGLTGFELCKTLSSLSLTQRIPILVLSGNPVEQFRDYCSHLGADDYFQKPIDFVRLRTRINQLLNERLFERRPELRLKMQVAIELRGLNRFGKAFHEVTATQDISVTGFRCACAAPLGQKSVVEVFLRGGSTKRRVGRAEVVHAPRSGQDSPQYGFHFTQKPSEWLL